MPNPIDLPCLEALHAEATRFYANGRIELTHDDETARRWAVVIFEAFPALLRELNDLRAERDRLRAELADRDAEIAGLREAARKVLDVPASYDDFGNMIVSAEDRNSFITALSDALSRTPDQHRARIEAAGLREAAVRLRKQDCSDEAVRAYEWLTDEAERLERGE